MGLTRRYVGNGVWEDVDDGKADQPTTGVPNKTLENLGVALDDVATRFLLHLPASELASADRLFFQIEQAHWFYEDFLADAPGSKLPHLQMRVFAQHLFKRCTLLRPMRQAVEDMFESFREYKGKIPVCGCILLDKSLTKLVLVRNWAKTSWGLPKGKLNQNEPLFKCAAREVSEETGYDPTNLMDIDNPIEMINENQRRVMFVVPDVPLDFDFKPRVRKEISKVSFFSFDALPDKEWNVGKFIPRIKRWIKAYRHRVQTQRRVQKTSPAPISRPLPPPLGPPLGHHGAVAAARPPSAPLFVENGDDESEMGNPRDRAISSASLEYALSSFDPAPRFAFNVDAIMAAVDAKLGTTAAVRA